MSLIDSQHCDSHERGPSAGKETSILTPNPTFKTTDRTFDFRLNSTYADPGNILATLHVEHRVDQIWQPFQLDVQTRGFLIFVYSCFICQHTYLRVNATEQGLDLAFISGSFKMTTSHDWYILAINAEFDVYLSAGNAGHGQVHYLVERMKGCPVSRNLGQDVEKCTNLTIHGIPNNVDI